MKTIFWTSRNERQDLLRALIFIGFLALGISQRSSWAQTCAVPPSGLISWWAGEGNASDVAGTNNGVLIGGTGFTNGEVGAAFSFNGVSQYVDVTNSSSLNPTGGITLEAWINPELPLNAIASPIIKKAGEGFAQQDGYTLEMHGAGVVIFGAYVNGIGWVSTPAAPIPTNEWSYVTGVYDGTNASIYVNGVLVGTPTSALGQIVPSGNDLQIGHDPSNSGRYFNGLIDEASVYGRALSSAEVQSIYNAGIAGKCRASEPPFFLTQPRSQTVNGGANVTFSAVVAGTGPLLYQWQVGGNSLSGANTPTLTLTNVQPTNSGSYTIVVVNGAGAGYVESSNAVLTVDEFPPSIMIQPQSQTNSAEASASFSVTASGTGILSYQWQFRGTNLAGATTSVLNLNDIQPANAGVYAVVITNLYGILTSSNATLTVDTYPPSIATQPQSQTNGAGANVTFSVTASGTSPLSYQWQFGEATLAGATSSSLNLNNIQLTNAGIYTVVVTNLYGMLTSSNATLTVNTFPPSIVIQPPNQTANAGGNVTFNVLATGSPPLSYQWQFVGMNLAGATNSVLSLSNVQPTNAGVYTVMITNLYGTIISSNATLTVNTHPPSITTQPQSQTVNAGVDVSMSVVAAGTLPLSYQWQLEGTNLTGATISALNLANVQPNSMGNYTVTITNLYGSVTSSNAILSVNVSPCVLPPSGLVGWWNGEDNASDSVGGNNGTLQGGASFVPGEVGQAFSFDGVSGAVVIPDGPGLDFGSNSPMTVELWAYRTGTQNNMSLMGKRGLNCSAAIEYEMVYDASAGGLLFNCGPSGTSGGVYTGLTMPLNTWIHLAATFDGSTFLFYTNGVLAASGTGSIGPTNNAPLTIGTAGDCPYFAGLLDEVSLYNRALSAEEIQGIYNAGAGGKCQSPPAVINQPTGQTVTAGASVNLSVVASGATPLSYQWQVGGVNIAGATNLVLSLNNVQVTNTGTYSVTVSNFLGSAVSVGAPLIVNAVPVCLSPPSGLVGWWRGEGDASDSSVSGNNGTLDSGVSFAPGEVGEAFSFDGVSGEVVIPDAPDLNFGSTSPMSLEFWAYSTSTSTPQHIVGKRVGGCSSAIEYQIVYDANNGGLLFNCGIAGTSGGVYTGLSLPLNTWIHLAVTFDGSNFRFYTNAVLAATGSGIIGTINNAPLTIGTSGGCPYFAGLLDEVSLYNRALSATEIQSIYNAGSAGKCYPAIEPVVLNGAQANGTLTLSWPVSATGFSLESNASLTSPDWTAVTAMPTTNGDDVNVTVPVPEQGQIFYRLIHP